MGLSDEERFAGMTAGVAELVEFANNRRPEWYRTEEILKRINNLWPALLGSEKNGIYWIMGSDFRATHITPRSLIGAALYHNRPSDESWPRGDFDIRDMITAEVLANDEEMSFVIGVMQRAESLSYYARRYDDKFLKSFKRFNDELSKLQGACFSSMYQDERYLAVWAICNIVDKCLGHGPEEKDIVYKWWAKHNIYHDVRYRRELSLRKLLSAYKTIQNQYSHEISPTRRILLTLFLAGRRYHYEHQHREAIKMFEEYNVENPTKKIRIRLVKKALQKCSDEYDAQQAYDQKQYRDNQFCWVTYFMRDEEE